MHSTCALKLGVHMVALANLRRVCLALRHEPRTRVRGDHTRELTRSLTHRLGPPPRHQCCPRRCTSSAAPHSSESALLVTKHSLATTGISRAFRSAVTPTLDGRNQRMCKMAAPDGCGSTTIVAAAAAPAAEATRVIRLCKSAAVTTFPWRGAGRGERGDGNASDRDGRINGSCFAKPRCPYDIGVVVGHRGGAYVI
jgi:hypothetical protein